MQLQGRHSGAITALQRTNRVFMSDKFYPSCQVSQYLLSSPSLHGGRGATPSEGGRPSDLSALAGGGISPNFTLLVSSAAAAAPSSSTYNHTGSSILLSSVFPGRNNTRDREEGTEETGDTEGRGRKNVDNQEGGDSGVPQPAVGANPRLRPRLPQHLLYSWYTPTPTQPN